MHALFLNMHGLATDVYGNIHTSCTCPPARGGCRRSSDAFETTDHPGDEVFRGIVEEERKHLQQENEKENAGGSEGKEGKDGKESRERGHDDIEGKVGQEGKEGKDGASQCDPTEYWMQFQDEDGEDFYYCFNSKTTSQGIPSPEEAHAVVLVDERPAPQSDTGGALKGGQGGEDEHGRGASSLLMSKESLGKLQVKERKLPDVDWVDGSCTVALYCSTVL